jgi:hypothetical protein
LEKKEIVRSYIFQGLKVTFQISGITKHQYIIKENQTRSSLFYQYIYTDSYGQKAEVSNDFVRNEASSPGFRHRLWLSKENCITNQGL